MIFGPVVFQFSEVFGAVMLYARADAENERRRTLINARIVDRMLKRMWVEGMWMSAVTSK
jgi:hypothetical protein